MSHNYWNTTVFSAFINTQGLISKQTERRTKDKKNGKKKVEIFFLKKRI